MIYVAALKTLPKLAGITIHLLRVAQITNDNSVQVAILQQDEAFTQIPGKYSDFANMVLFKLVMELPNNMDINKYTIELKKNKQPPYRPIYSSKLIEL